MWKRQFPFPSKPFRRWVKAEEIPGKYVEIPPLTSKQYAALRNANTAIQVVTAGVTTGISAMAGAAIGIRGGAVGGVVGTVVGAVVGSMWGAYEVSCLNSVQEQFDRAYRSGKSIQVWRQGWKYNVHGGGDTYTHVNAPISAAYVAIVTFLLTGELP